MDAPTLRLARGEDSGILIPFVRAYHEFEGIDLSDESRKTAVDLLLVDSSLGRIWLIESQQVPVGYICLCFGYSIEFSGRDAFVDEFFILPPYRGRGLGRSALISVCSEAELLGIRALHLEVSRRNDQAKSLYRSLGFESRQEFHLMSRLLPASSR